MPARVSRSSLSTPKTKALAKNKNKTAKRSLNAFAIASAENPSTHKIRRSRLGEVEDDGPRFKRRRDEHDEEEEVVKKKPRDAESDSGGDGEGNHWKVGVVEEDDDSDIDSEDAFGSSDEEKYAGWSFGAGKSKSKARKKIVQAGDDLEEGEDEDEEDLESLGSDAVDLVTMLDNYRASDDEEDGVESEDDDENADEDLPSDLDMSETEENDEDKIARLHKLVSRLHPEEKVTRKPREADSHESRVPSVSGLVSSEKFDIKDFLATTSDPQLKKVSKEIGNLPKTSKKDLKLQPSLPKRQKDRLDRVAANEKAKQTLERWVDTVKQQRQAEHLSFPLVDPETAKPAGSRFMLPTDQSKPLNDLESAIQNILQESGLTSGRRDEEEEKLQQFEELKTNKMPIEEVQARRAELRKARDLLFREEVRAKRIKKIKSKAYRRIHRKEREKMAALERDAFAEGAEAEMDDEEKEAADRRRAEERMGLKHKDSKWAKQMKKSGRTMWDDDAISGVSEMAKKNEELMRRIEGKDIRHDDASGDEILSSSEDEDDSEVDGDGAEFQSLKRQLEKAEGYRDSDGKMEGLQGLKFMKNAEARRKQQNREDIERMRRELAGEESHSEDEETIGRKIFAPVKVGQIEVRKPEAKGEFEEPDDEEGGVEIIINDSVASSGFAGNENGSYTGSKGKASKSTAPAKQALKSILKPAKEPMDTVKPKIAAPVKAKPSTNIELLLGEKHSQPDADGWVTVRYDHEEEEQPEAKETGLLDQTEILRRAFAGDDVEDQFEAEKNAAIASEDEKTVDTTLPGWGSWVGQSLSKREKRDNFSRRTSKKVDGIRPEQRKDRKLGNVIINQKRVKKNAGYLAGELPFPFKTRQEYERSIRMPLGGEWNVKGIYQDNVKPRVMVKPGAIVKPMEKPLV